MYLYSVCTPVSTRVGTETMREYLETLSDKSISSNSFVRSCKHYFEEYLF